MEIMRFWHSTVSSVLLFQICLAGSWQLDQWSRWRAADSQLRFHSLFQNKRSLKYVAPWACTQWEWHGHIILKWEGKWEWAFQKEAEWRSKWMFGWGRWPSLTMESGICVPISWKPSAFVSLSHDGDIPQISDLSVAHYQIVSAV